MNKTQKVLRHLQTKGTITSLEAINLYNATRLSAIIFTLRKKYDIAMELEYTKDEDGRRIPYGVYHMNKND